MIRNFKVLGLTLVAALALGAMGASAASAQNYHFTSSQEHTTLTGKQVGTDVFTVDAGKTSCEEANYSGTQSGTTALEITLVPSYSQCKVEPIGSAVIDMNSCDYVFTAKTKPNVEVHIVCANAGDKIQVTASALGTLKCTVDIAPQTLTGVTVEAVAGGDITGKVNISGISYQQTSGSGLGACAAKTNTNGTYVGHATIDGGVAELGLANT